MRVFNPKRKYMIVLFLAIFDSPCNCVKNSVGEVEFYIHLVKMLLTLQVTHDGELVPQLVKCDICSQMESFIIVLPSLLKNFTVVIMVGDR